MLKCCVQQGDFCEHTLPRKGYTIECYQQRYGRTFTSSYISWCTSNPRLTLTRCMSLDKDCHLFPAYINRLLDNENDIYFFANTVNIFILRMNHNKLKLTFT